jgi:hypothetical protein
MRALLALSLIACSSPPPPTLPPRSEIGPDQPAATECFPPYNGSFAHDWFVLADLDLGVSCRVFLEQDDCVLGIFDDCTDPSPSSRQWVGKTSSEMTRDRLQFQIFEGNGSVVGRPPKCCNGELIDGDWSHLDCKLTACDNQTDQIHVGALLERETAPAPFADPAGREELSSTVTIRDFALLAAKREIWAVTQSEIVVQALGGATQVLDNVVDAELLVADPDERWVYVADGDTIMRIDVNAREQMESVDLGGPVEILEHTSRGILAGAVSGDTMMLSLHRRDDLTVIDASGTLPRLAAVIEVPNGTSPRAFLAAPLEARADLVVLTSSLAIGSGAPNTERSPRAFVSVGGGAIGFLAECSERSTEQHCWFEVDLATNGVRRTGIPDIGDIIDAVHHAPSERVVFSGPEGLGVLDRAAWRPLVQARVAIDGAGKLALFGSDLYAAGRNGVLERFTLR